MSIYLFIIEPRAVTRLPFQATDHTEFGRTSASHVVASFLEFNHRRTVVASLPTFLFCHFHKFFNVGIFGALLRSMHLVIAGTTDLRSTSFTFAHFPAVFKGDMIGFNPFAAASRRAVSSVPCSKLLKLTIPGLLERLIK